MINGNSAALAWTNVGDYLNNNNSATLRNVSIWLPSERDFPNRNQNKDAFANSIINVFAGQPQRHAPTIKDQNNSQSLIDFFGRGLNAQGPATHSNSAPKHPQQSVEKHGNFLEFLGNPFGKPSSSIQPDRYSSVAYREKCQYV